MNSLPDHPSALYRELMERVLSDLGLRLSERQTAQLATHFALLVHWNRRINLTSVRRPEDIAVRHFGESLFLVKLLGQVDTGLPACTQAKPGESAPLLVDVGSGAGFPGLPIKIACPAMTAVLLEPTLKKIAFLKEVIRHCDLVGIEARAERLEEVVNPDSRDLGDLAGRAALVTLRAVALTPDLLSDLKKLLARDGRLALFLGERDALVLAKAHGTKTVPWLPALIEMQWEPPVPIPHSERRVILVGRKRNE